MIKYACMVGSSYKPPARQEIGGTLLDINHKNIVENNKEVLCHEADIFGLTWLSDGATIACMPLIIFLAFLPTLHQLVWQLQTVPVTCPTVGRKM